MFGKLKDMDVEKMETVIGPDTFFQGTFRSKGYIRVDGKVEGSLSAEGVIIGASGQIQGDVAAKAVVIGGKVTGNIIASDSLELQPQSQVLGDIRAAHLAIADGALFEGNCIMATDKTKVIEMDEVITKSAKS